MSTIPARFLEAARRINMIEVDAQGARMPGRPGGYMQADVLRQVLRLPGTTSTIISFEPRERIAGNQCLLLFMGGPYESRTTYDGLPCALAWATGMTVFSVSYLGSQQMVDGPTNPLLVKDMLTGEGEFDHERIAGEIHALVRRHVWGEGFMVTRTFCHSYGAAAFLTWAAHYRTDSAMRSVVFCEPYWPIAKLATMDEVHAYGYSYEVRQAGPFKEFGEALVPRLRELGNMDFHLLLAGGFRNALSRAIAAQAETTYAGVEPEYLPGANHGMNLKHVNLTNWGGMKREEVERAVALLLWRIAEC